MFYNLEVALASRHKSSQNDRRQIIFLDILSSVMQLL